MNGYIGITSREWYEFLVEHQIHNEINFWRKNTNPFKVLKLAREKVSIKATSSARAKSKINSSSKGIV